MNILGLSAFYHDSAACLVRDGQIIAAAQEERFTRKKHDAAFPKNAVEYCLREGGITLAQVDYVAFYEKPFLKFDRLLHSYLAYAPSGLKTFLMAIPLWIRERIWMKTLIQEELQSLTFAAHLSQAGFRSPNEPTPNPSQEGNKPVGNNFTGASCPAPLLGGAGGGSVLGAGDHSHQEIAPAPGDADRPRFFATASVRERTWSFS